MHAVHSKYLPAPGVIHEWDLWFLDNKEYIAAENCGAKSETVESL